MIIDRMNRSGRAAELIRRRLAGLASLADDDLALIEAACDQIELHPAGADIAEPRIIVSGWACHRRRLPDATRQIFSFLVPGDLVPARHARGRTGWCALTSLETVRAGPMLAAAESGDHIGLADAIEAMQAEQERLLLDHILRLGRLSAYERTAHLMLEFRDRLARLGLADEERLPMPLTQETLADALGLSIVHVNRTLQQLRREGLIELRSGVAVLPDRPALTELCGYEAPEVRRRSAPAPMFGAFARPTRADEPLRSV